MDSVLRLEKRLSLEMLTPFKRVLAGVNGWTYELTANKITTNNDIGFRIRFILKKSEKISIALKHSENLVILHRQYIFQRHWLFRHAGLGSVLKSGD